MSGERLELRPYQRTAYGRVREAFAAGALGALVVMPTGGGKTLLGAEFVASAVRQGHAVEWYAHREELIDQARGRLIAQGVSLDRVRVTTVQTEIARGASRARWELPPGRKVVRILDEAHHYAADKWAEVAQGDGPLLGLTATPERGDGRGLGRTSGGPFDVLVNVASVRELQALGHLVPCVTYAPAGPTKELSQDPVAAYLSRTPGERCLVFCRDVKHAERLTMSFLRANVPAACLHGGTSDDLRRARLAAFASQTSAPLLFAGTQERAPLVICNAHLLTEGLDVTTISCIILARGCDHAGAMLQMVGRGMRAAPGTDKTRCVFLDLRGVTRRRNRKGQLVIGLPEQDRTWSLDGKDKSLGAEEAERPTHTCPACDATVTAWSTDAAGWRTCPTCHERVSAPALDVPIAPRALHAYGSGVPEGERREAMLADAKRAAKEGYKPGYIAHRYLERFGVWPPFGAADAALRDALADRKARNAKPKKPRAARPVVASAAQEQEQWDAEAEWQAYLDETARCG